MHPLVEQYIPCVEFIAHEIQRGLTTSSVAIFVPFTTQELFQDGKEALYLSLIHI